MGDLQDVTINELARRVDRLDTAMASGFQSMREEIQRLAFVPAAVYAADRSGDQERIRRLEEGAKLVDQRAWQARTSLIVAVVGLPLSIIGSIIVAMLLAQMK